MKDCARLCRLLQAQACFAGVNGLFLFCRCPSVCVAVCVAFSLPVSSSPSRGHLLFTRLLVSLAATFSCTSLSRRLILPPIKKIRRPGPAPQEIHAGISRPGPLTQAQGVAAAALHLNRRSGTRTRTGGGRPVAAVDAALAASPEACPIGAGPGPMIPKAVRRPRAGSADLTAAAPKSPGPRVWRAQSDRAGGWQH